MNLAGKGKKAKSSMAPPKAKKKKKAEVAPMADEEVSVDTPDAELELPGGDNPTTNRVASVSERVPAFEGGFVNSAFKSAVNASWRKTDEIGLVCRAMTTVFAVEGVYFGDISIKPSFVKRAGGSALM